MSSLTGLICETRLSIQITEIALSGAGLICSVVLLVLGTRGFAALQREDMSVPMLFKYMFYSCVSMAFAQYALVLLNVFYCSPYNILISFVLYGIIATHLYISWLSRLYFTFTKSVYAKSNLFYAIASSLFITFILTAIAGVLLFALDVAQFAAVSLLIVAAFGYMSMSMWLMLVFARQLLRLISNQIITMRFRTEQTLRQKTESLDLSFKDEELVNCISRYLVLGLCSLFTTFCILGFALFDFIAAQIGYRWKPESVDISILHVFIILVMVDVFANNMCIYLQFKFARDWYAVCCKCFNHCINVNVHKIAVRKLRRKTFSFYASQFEQTQRKEEALKMGIDVNAATIHSTQHMDPEHVPTFSSAHFHVSEVSVISSNVTSPGRVSEIDGKQKVESQSPEDEEDEHEKDDVVEFDKMSTAHSKNNSSLDFEQLINLQHLTIKRVSSAHNESVQLEIVNEHKQQPVEQQNDRPTLEQVHSGSVET